jgi:SAM-dependent methyltransferase
VATDASEAQLARAEPDPRVEYRRATAEASGLPDSSVDLAAAAQAAHWFHLEAYYAEVRRVARPGAAVALVTYGLASAGAEVDPVLEEFYTRTLGPHWPPERRHVEDAYRSLPFPFREVEAPGFVMEAEWGVEEVLGYVGTWSAVRALERAEGRVPLESFRRKLTEAWGGKERRRRVRWTLSLRVGRV